MEYGFGHAVDSSLVLRLVLAIRVTRGGLEPSAIESSANFPTSLTGDVTSEIAEDDWVRGCVDSRLKVPYSGFFINGRGIPDSKSSFPGFRIPQQKFDAIWIPEAKISPIPEGPCRVKNKPQSICAVARTGSLE